MSPRTLRLAGTHESQRAQEDSYSADRVGSETEAALGLGGEQQGKGHPKDQDCANVVSPAGSQQGIRLRPPVLLVAQVVGLVGIAEGIKAGSFDHAHAGVHLLIVDAGS